MKREQELLLAMSELITIHGFASDYFNILILTDRYQEAQEYLKGFDPERREKRL